MFYRKPHLARRFYRAATGIICAAFVTLLMPTPALPAGLKQSQSPVKILWFVGLGGFNDQEIATEKRVTQQFNDTIGKQDNIELDIQIGSVGQSFDPVQMMCLLVSSGNPPDIVGPITMSESNVTGNCRLSDYWMDLKPLIDKTHYDLSAFDPALLNLYRTPNGGYNALPFAVYPTVLYYNTTLFDKAGLHYPPTKFGAKYTMPDGSKVDWNYDTLAKLAKMLTFDENGNAATSAKFDSTHILQYGLNFQWDSMRLILADIQPSQFYAPVTGKVTVSADWRTATHWVWNGLWRDHFISTSTAEASPLLQPSAFDSGHLAMAITPLWYTCCLQDTVGKLKWNIGVVPQSLDGQYHVATDADTFRVIKTIKNPDAAFTALTYLVDNAAPQLAQTYMAFPARSAYQQSWIDAENKIYPQGVDWKVATDSLKYTNPAALHHESNLPHFQQVQDRFASFYTLLFGNTGATINVDKELDKLQSDLNSIVEGTPVPTVTPIPTATPAATK